MLSNEIVRFDRVVKDYPVGGLVGFGSLRAVDRVSFHVGRGEVVGLLGPNRAGKTTLAKILLSLCSPTSGTVTRLGAPARDRSTLARVGYMHDGIAFPLHLTAEGLLDFYGALSGVNAQVRRERIPTLLESVGLADRKREPIARFSKGMLQRLGLAQALINDPELLVLDEPAEGLDLPGRKTLTELVRRRCEAGRSALVITHSASEVERLCDRVVVLVAGRLVHDGPTAALRAHGRETIEPALSRLYRKVASC